MNEDDYEACRGPTSGITIYATRSWSSDVDEEDLSAHSMRRIGTDLLPGSAPAPNEMDDGTKHELPAASLRR